MRCVLILRVLSYITGYDTRFCYGYPLIFYCCGIIADDMASLLAVMTSISTVIAAV